MPALFLYISSLFILGSPIDPQPVELGKVQWLRDYDHAMVEAQKKQLPVLILFQEVPGCSTCQQYGQQVLSHPLIVDLIHTNFVPLAIYNNKRGKDAEILARYEEPSWNNPVVRIVDDSGEMVAPRLAGNYSALGLVRAIKQAIINNQRVVPEYLYLLENELIAQRAALETATYSMYCFWTGEKVFGAVEGVVKTRAGWSGGREVVQVQYNPNILSKKSLDKIAQQNSCQKLSETQIRDDRTPKYYLSNSDLQYVPLTELQASRINARLANGENYLDLLSPTQQKWLFTVQKSSKKQYKNLVQMDIAQAWEIFEKQLLKG